MQNGKLPIFVSLTLLILGASSVLAGPFTTCSTKGASPVFHTGADGSNCFAQSDGIGAATAKARDNGSEADADVSSGPGKATAITTGGGFSEADSDTGSISKATSLGNSQANATSDEHGNASSTAMNGAEADTSAFGNCKTKATAIGAGSSAIADCQSAGQKFTASATGGGSANVNSSFAHCNASAGQTAKVTGNGFTCKAP